MAEEDALPEEALAVSVMHMMNPSTFWVTEPLGRDMTKEREQLNNLEEMLSGHCRRSSSFQGFNYVPEDGELVAVQHPETGRWHRAQVEYALHVTKGYVYKVFLVDHGIPLQVRGSAMRELPEMWSKLNFQAHQVVLYGIIPTSVEMDYQEMKMKRKVTSNWTAAAVRFIKNILEQSTKSWLSFNKSVKNKIYGDLFLELPNGCLSLSKELCSKEYAVWSEEFFEEELTKSDEQKEELFCKIPSPQSLVCTDSGASPSSSPVPLLGDKSERRLIRDYIQEYNDRQATKVKKNLNRIKEWRREPEGAAVDTHEYGESFRSDREEPLGRGMSIRRRNDISPGVCSKSTLAEVDPVEKWSGSNIMETLPGSKTKMSSMLDLLDLIDSQPDHGSKSMSELNTLCVENNNSSLTEYIPAGSYIDASNIKSQDTRGKVITSSLNKRSPVSVDIRSDAHLLSCRNSKKNGHSLDGILSQCTNVETERMKVQSSVINQSEYGEQISGEKLQRPLSLLKCLERKMISNDTDGIDMKHDIEKEVTSVPTRSLFQDIVNSVAKSTQSKRQVLLDDAKNSSLSPSNIPDMKARLPQAALKAMKRKASGNDSQVKSVNSLASLEQAVLPPVQAPTLSAGYKVAERIQTSRILVHGDMRFRIIQSIAEANFPKEIHQALAKMGVKEPMRIQTYAWPAIMRGQYTVLVGPPRSGKTLSYVVPLVSFMLTPDLYSDLRPGNGPLVLVLCPGSRSAQFVYEKCCTLLELANQNKVRVNIAYGGGREEVLREPLANGCDILISTPRCFMRLLRCSRFITNMDRLAHLVLDEVDILAQKFLSELKEVITECKRMLMRRSKVGVPVQVIAASEKWCPAVEQFSQHISQNFLVCISGYLEAAVYAKLQPTLHFLSVSSKPQAVLDILDGYQGLYKTVIVCQLPTEVEELVPFLQSQCYQVLAVHEDMTQCHIGEVWNRWKCSIVPGTHPVLVCTDDVLPELNMNDAMWLIHYSFPLTKTGFGFRFSCLMNNYRNIFQKSADKDDCPECKVHIFADKDQKIKELPEVVSFLKRLSVPITPDIEAKAMDIVCQKESQKIGAPLCYYVKAFGECLERTVCKRCHIISDTVDRHSNIPFCGEVKVKILHVHDASSFSARILEHTDVSGCTVPIPDEYFTINMAVYSHYSEVRNRVLHGVPKLGDLCSVESTINIFKRVQVLEVVKEDTKGVPEELKVKLLDEGTFSVVKVYQLLALPEDLQQLPPQVVDIFLCNVMPCDLDTGWSETASSRMSAWINKISREEEDGKYIVGKVMLSVGNTLWLDPLQCRNFLTSLDTHVMELSLSKELVKCNLAVSNPSHLNKLYELCHAGGLAVPSYKKVPTLKKVQHKIQVLPSPQWAHLDTEEFEEVTFVYADSPHHFFVRLHKFNDCFQRLIDELQKCEKTKPKDFHLEKGSYCISRFPEDSLWYRAQVEQLLEGDRVSLFFVDHGDHASVNMDDIAPITEMLIMKLPFQAIECSLAGITPLDGDTWSEEATDMLYEFTDRTDITFIKVCEVVKAATYTGGRKYKVLLVDTCTDVNIYLNSVLLEKNLALSNNLEQLLEKSNLVHSGSDGASEESDVEPETQVVKLSDLSMPEHSDPNTSLSLAENSILDTSDDEGYDIVIDNLEEFLMDMIGLRSDREPSLPALPAPPALTSPDGHSSSKGDSASCISSQYFSSDDEGDDADRIPPLVSTTRTPQVLWHQDECTIYMKIMITGVQKYYLGWDMMHLQFSTEVNSQVYGVMLDLYGPINASGLTHTPKGFFVQMKMMKIVTGYHWPRLLRSQYKRPWLKLDLEKYKDGIDSDEENVETRCNRALKELSSSNKKVKIAARNFKDENGISHITSSSDDDTDSDEMESYDPFDPLN